MMTASLTSLIALACPAGMAAMMGIPMLARRVRRRQAPAQPVPSQPTSAGIGAAGRS